MAILLCEWVADSAHRSVGDRIVKQPYYWNSHCACEQLIMQAVGASQNNVSPFYLTFSYVLWVW
jgi:hypothetical protein